MTHLIYKSSVPHVMPECPEKTDHPCEQTSDHDCPMCNGYKLALASSIAKAIPVVESDRESVKIECWNIENRKTINGLREIWSEWLPPDNAVFELDAEFETSEQEQTHLCTACRVDCLAALGKGTCKAPKRQVARLKAQTPEKKESIPAHVAYPEMRNMKTSKIGVVGSIAQKVSELHPSSPIETKQASEGKWDFTIGDPQVLSGERGDVESEVTLFNDKWSFQTSIKNLKKSQFAELQAIASTLNGEVGEQEETLAELFEYYSRLMNDGDTIRTQREIAIETLSKYTIIKKP